MRRPLIPSTVKPLKMMRSARLSVTRSDGNARAARPFRRCAAAAALNRSRWRFPDISSSTSTPSPLVRARISSTRPLCVATKVASAPSFAASSSFAGFTSIAKTEIAPAAARPNAISPIEPTPMIATLLTLTPAAITVCTALPSGSKIAAYSSGIAGIEPPHVILGHRNVLAQTRRHDRRR